LVCVRLRRSGRIPGDSTHDIAQLVAEKSPVYRFRGEGCGAGFIGAVDGEHVVTTGDHDNRQMSVPRAGADGFAQAETRHVRHFEITQDQVEAGLVLLQDFPGLLTVFGRHNLAARMGQLGCREFAH